jgi:DNA topoisomerase-1
MNDWEARARTAGLQYIRVFEKGYSRRKCGKGFKYIDEEGRTITCSSLKERLSGLVIPPAWRNVWICTDEDGHIQATGFDEAGRKQYIYHPRWHEASAAHKYGRLILFAGLLPAIRRTVRNDLESPELSKRRVVAAVVRLLDKASIRIGNKQYLEANDSRGATTLTSDHICRDDSGINLNFKGKSGKQIELKCSDNSLAAFLEDCQKSEGEFLFSYQNANNEYVAVTSSDVNKYLMEAARESVTAKDFRTWRGSVTALWQLSEMQEGMSKTAKKKFIVDAVKATAAVLGNTTAVCRKSYIHSAILHHAEEGSLPEIMRNLNATHVRRTGLSKHETTLVAFLKHAEKDYNNRTAIAKPLPLKIAA